MRPLVAVALALVGLVAGKESKPALSPNTSAFAEPEIIIFHGGALARPIAITAWRENHLLLLTQEPHEPLLSGRRATNSARPVIELALFWGVEWRAYATSPERLARLTPAEANQRGRFFPAVPGEHALIDVGSISGPVSDSGLAILRRHEIPTQSK
jgi:hypothetical protein